MTTAPYSNRISTFSTPSASSRSVEAATDVADTATRHVTRSDDCGPRNARGDPCPAHPERSPFVAERIVRDVGIDTQRRGYLHVCVQTRGRGRSGCVRRRPHDRRVGQQRVDHDAIERLFAADRDPDERCRDDDWFPESCAELKELYGFDTVATRRRWYGNLLIATR